MKRVVVGKDASIEFEPSRAESAVTHRITRRARLSGQVIEISRRNLAQSKEVNLEVIEEQTHNLCGDLLCPVIRTVRLNRRRQAGVPPGKDYR